MELFNTVERYDQKTGKKIGIMKVYKETRCDYTGEVVDDADHNDYPGFHCKFILDYEDQDPCMGSGGLEYEFGQKYKVEMFQFLNQPYTILNDAAGDKGTAYPGFFKSLAKSKFYSLEDAFRTMRVKTAIELIATGQIEASELNRE